MENVIGEVYLRGIEFFSLIGAYVSPGAQKAFFIGLGIFLFLLLFAFTRHHMLSWSIRGAWFGIVLGIVVALAVEAFLLVGGRTLVVEAIKNERTPKSVRVFLQENLTELAQSLAGEPKTLSAAEEATGAADVVLEFQRLPPLERQKARQLICTP